jgi:predicted oxidoreductase
MGFRRPDKDLLFAAVKILMGDLGTLAGIATDEYARVLTQQGEPIVGLYAVGNDMASIMHGDYLGGGSTLGPAMTLGYIAACHIARNNALESAA